VWEVVIFFQKAHESAIGMSKKGRLKDSGAVCNTEIYTSSKEKKLPFLYGSWRPKGIHESVYSHSSGKDSIPFILEKNNNKLSSFTQVKNQRFLSFNP